MKKIYQNPVVQVIKIAPATLIAESMPTIGDGKQSDFDTKDEGDWDELWDDWDE